MFVPISASFAELIVSIRGCRTNNEKEGRGGEENRAQEQGPAPRRPVSPGPSSSASSSIKKTKARHSTKVAPIFPGLAFVVARCPTHKADPSARQSRIHERGGGLPVKWRPVFLRRRQPRPYGWLVCWTRLLIPISSEYTDNSSRMYGSWCMCCTMCSVVFIIG